MFKLYYEAALLAFEANHVIGLRLMKMSMGGVGASAEAERMVSEKISAAAEATGTLMAGGSPETVIKRYRQHVAANARRLTAA